MESSTPLTEEAALAWAAQYDEPWKHRAEWCCKFPGKYDEAKKVLFYALQGELPCLTS